MKPTDQPIRSARGPTDRRDAARTDDRRGSTQPTLQRLRIALDELAAPDLASVTALVGAVLADTRWIDGWLAGMAASARCDAFYQPPLATLNNGFYQGLAIFAHPLVKMSLGVLPIDALANKKLARGAPASITFTGTVTLQKFLRSGGARLTMWHATPASDRFSLDDQDRCRPGDARTLHDGDLLVLDGRRDSYVVDHAIGAMVVLQAELSIGRSPFAVEYDAASLIAIAASSTDEGASRSQMLLSFLAALGRTSDIPEIARFADDPLFFLRWHAVSALLSIDADAAMPRLRRMAARDPHPDARMVARETLAIIAGADAGETLSCRA